MITIYQKTLTSRRLKIVDDFKIGSWVHAEDPTPEELSRLSEKLGLDPGLLYDATDPYEVPRVETDNGNTYIFTRVPYEDATGKINTAPVLLALTNEHVITVARVKLPFFEKFIEGKREFHTTQKLRFLTQILEEIATAYARFITIINKEVRRLSGNLGHAISNEDIIAFVNFESILNDLLDALVPTNATLQKILSGKSVTIYEGDHDFIEDVFLGNNQLIELARANLRTIMNIRDAYSSIMGNNLNRVIKVLTALTIVFTIPTIVFNIYGMNIPLPFQDSAHAFWIVVLMTALATGASLLVMHRKNLM